MKFNFKLDVKGVPTANCSCEFECSPDELSIMLSDPVYQELGAKLINEVSFKPKTESHQKQHNADRFEHMRRVMEAEVKHQANHNKEVDTAIKNMQDQLNRMFNRIINNTKF